MNEFEKMKAGEWTDVSAPEIVEPNNRVVVAAGSVVVDDVPDDVMVADNPARVKKKF